MQSRPEGESAHYRTAMGKRSQMSRSGRASYVLIPLSSEADVYILRSRSILFRLCARNFYIDNLLIERGPTITF